jgi:Na+/phosphate symporter
MSTVARTTGATIVSLLGTIGSTAGAIAKTIDAAASSVDMLDAFVQRSLAHQRDTHLVQDHHWRRNLILDSAQAQEKIETDIKAEYAGNAVRQHDFNSIVSDLESLFTVTTP